MAVPWKTHRSPTSRREKEPGTPEARIPETVSYTDGFIPHDVEWKRGGQAYRRATCPICHETFGTCRGTARFTELKLKHQNECWPCLFRDCIDCNEPKCSCTFDGGWIIQCATCWKRTEQCKEHALRNCLACKGK